MTLPRNPLLLAAALLAVGGAGWIALPSGAIASAQNGPVPHLDDDADGLDNALEMRIGTLYDHANTDGDALGDLDELIIGTDPATSNAIGGQQTAEPSMLVEAYASGNKMIFQTFVSRRDIVHKMTAYIAVPNPNYPASSNDPVLTIVLKQSKLQSFLNRALVLSSPIPNYEVYSARSVMPLSTFTRLVTFAVAFCATLDQGVKVADEVRFTTDSIGRLLEWRDDGVLAGITAGQQGGGSGSSTGRPGGLFPADPLATPPPGESLQHMVCVQELALSGVSGVSRLYTVADAYCDTLPVAVCLAECAATAGDSLVGIDLASLIQ